MIAKVAAALFWMNAERHCFGMMKGSKRTAVFRENTKDGRGTTRWITFLASLTKDNASSRILHQLSFCLEPKGDAPVVPTDGSLSLLTACGSSGYK